MRYFRFAFFFLLSDHQNPTQQDEYGEEGSGGHADWRGGPGLLGRAEGAADVRRPAPELAGRPPPAAGSSNAAVASEIASTPAHQLPHLEDLGRKDHAACPLAPNLRLRYFNLLPPIAFLKS